MASRAERALIERIPEAGIDVLIIAPGVNSGRGFSEIRTIKPPSVDEEKTRQRCGSQSSLHPLDLKNIELGLRSFDSFRAAILNPFWQFLESSRLKGDQRSYSSPRMCAYEGPLTERAGDYDPADWGTLLYHMERDGLENPASSWTEVQSEKEVSPIFPLRRSICIWIFKSNPSEAGGWKEFSKEEKLRRRLRYPPKGCPINEGELCRLRREAGARPAPTDSLQVKVAEQAAAITALERQLEASERRLEASERRLGVQHVTGAATIATLELQRACWSQLEASERRLEAQRTTQAAAIAALERQLEALQRPTQAAAIGAEAPSRANQAAGSGGLYQELLEYHREHADAAVERTEARRTEEELCCICLEEPCDEARSFYVCGHRPMCSACPVNPTCPLCRSPRIDE